MKKNLPQSGPCRHEKEGRCSNEYWNVMKRAGKPGLDDYLCVLWKAKTEALEEYRRVSNRGRGFGLEDEKRIQAAEKAMARKTPREINCPNFHPDDELKEAIANKKERQNPAPAIGGVIRCRYYFLEACLLTFPECPGHCEEYLPCGDQTQD